MFALARSIASDFGQIRVGETAEVKMSLRAIPGEAGALPLEKSWWIRRSRSCAKWRRPSATTGASSQEVVATATLGDTKMNTRQSLEGYGWFSDSLEHEEILMYSGRHSRRSAKAPRNERSVLLPFPMGQLHITTCL